MKRILLFLALMMSVNAFAVCTVTNRVGLAIDLYSIDDVGHDYDNHRVVLMQDSPVVLIQQAGNNYTTWEESRFCMIDVDDTRCPWDDIDDVTPGIQYRSPIFMHLDTCTHIRGADFPRDAVDIWKPGIDEKHWYLGFWYEDKIKPIVNDAIDQMVSDGLNATQQKRALKYILFGNGIPLTGAGGATLMAADRVDSGIVWTYDDINLATIPQQDRLFIRHFGTSIFGW